VTFHLWNYSFLHPVLSLTNLPTSAWCPWMLSKYIHTYLLTYCTPFVQQCNISLPPATNNIRMAVATYFISEPKVLISVFGCHLHIGCKHQLWRLNCNVITRVEQPIYDQILKDWEPSSSQGVVVHPVLMSQ
jgi:hypothetical protein